VKDGNFVTGAVVLDDPQFLADLASTMSGRQVAERWPISKSTVNYYRQNGLPNGATTPERETIAEGASLTGSVERGVDGGSFIDVQTADVITDWSDIFKRFNLDPNEFVIVDDTVRMSNWQQSKGLEDGTRDIVNLYSYRATFTRKVAALVDVKGMTASLRAWKPAKRTAAPMGAPVTMFLGWADWQLGKGEGDGTAGTTQRILDSFQAASDRITTLRKHGVNIDSILFGNMGDHTEAVTGHYTSQTYSVDLNQRDQLNLALELNLTGIKALAPMVEFAHYSACLCNHGQWQRLAGKQITDDSDNSTGFIGDTLKTVCDLHPALNHMNWIIPRDEMITTGTFSGVNVAMSHGHKISGNEENWLAKQSAWLQTRKNFRPELWVTAHKHTALNEDMGNYHRVQCATNDPGSKSFTDGTGKFSTQGTTTFLIDGNSDRKLSHYEIL